jgi:hypothetical protein
MPAVAPASKLFHAIVVVGLSTAATGCGGSGQVAASKEAGEDAPTQGAADATSEVGSVDLGTDASEDAGIPVHPKDAGDAALDCDPAANPGKEGGCWPLFV